MFDVQDNVVRVWMMDSENSDIICVAAGYGHTHTVMAVAFFRCVFLVHLMLSCTVEAVLTVVRIFG